jgi:hypothetical protein
LSGPDGLGLLPRTLDILGLPELPGLLLPAALFFNPLLLKLGVFLLLLLFLFAFELFHFAPPVA